MARIERYSCDSCGTYGEQAQSNMAKLDDPDTSRRADGFFVRPPDGWPCVAVSDPDWDRRPRMTFCSWGCVEAYARQGVKP